MLVKFEKQNLNWDWFKVNWFKVNWLRVKIAEVLIWLNTYTWIEIVSKTFVNPYHGMA